MNLVDILISAALAADPSAASQDRSPQGAWVRAMEARRRVLAQRNAAPAPTLGASGAWTPAEGSGASGTWAVPPSAFPSASSFENATNADLGLQGRRQQK
jgi:hypothetical protein